MCTLGAFTHASDHADPLVLNPLNPPREREPRITDLHVFLDSDQEKKEKPENLVLSLAVFPSMPPLQRATAKSTNPIMLPAPAGAGAQPETVAYQRPDLDLDGYRYTIYIDLHSAISYENPGDLARYGGTILAPTDIAPEVVLRFTLNNDAMIKDLTIEGVAAGRVTKDGPFQPGAVNVRTGIFDDPFIFPRFFRTNVVGIVTSIPLDRFLPHQSEFVVWATTSKDGKQLDHVGRSQRTQLPRFDGLNPLPPSQHVAEINRRHVDPTLQEDFMRTFLSPLFGRRPYDPSPDVIIFNRGRDLKKPTLFPNGRKLVDDVASIVAQSGDTQLWEASYTDDPRFPRATTNDKPFSDKFPYLAPPWTVDETAVNPRPFPLGRPTLTNGNWRTIWFAEIALLTLLFVGLAILVKSFAGRLALATGWIIMVCLLQAIFDENLTTSTMAAMVQPGVKLSRTLLGGGVIAVLFVLFVFLLGRRLARRAAPVLPAATPVAAPSSLS